MIIDKTLLPLFFVAILVAAPNADAFKLQPFEKDVDADKVRSGIGAALQHLEGPFVKSYIDHFSTPVHEELTHRAYGCRGSHEECRQRLGAPRGAPKSVIEGVQWNDNPPFTVYRARPKIPASCIGITIQLPNLHPSCWGAVFASAQARATAGEAEPIDHKYTLLERSHFGDLQFLHAMAPDGESAQETRRKIFEWARFSYLVSIGTIASDARMSDPGAVGGISAFFPKRGYDVMTLFTRGTTPHSNERMQDMAFGSLLHVVQDSFSRSHVLRGDIRVTESDALPGQILQFHSYVYQDHRSHGMRDDLEALEQNVNEASFVTILGRRLVAMRARRAGWDEVRKALEPAFELSERALPSGPGKSFIIQPKPSPLEEPGPGGG